MRCLPRRLALAFCSEWSNAKANINAADRAEDIAASVKLTVKNTGQVAGADVVQLYVHDRESLLRRPYKELKGFKKVYLEPGESQKVEIKLDKLAFSYYDDGQNCWVAEAGAFDRESGRARLANLV
jgi:beta-glucosidase